jgi:hypothetical protein
MVLVSNRNALGAYLGLSHAKLFAGSVEEAIPLTEQAIRLSPAIPRSAFGIYRSSEDICGNRALPRRSSGSKRRVPKSR